MGKYLYRGDFVLLGDQLVPASIIVENGKIVKISRGNSHELPESQFLEVVDVGENILMPGVVDSHVHVNEPGRTAWEGYETATKAAAAGGCTCIVDMPLNSIPPTTTVANLETKLKAAQGKAYVDVAFWGGAVPGNEKDLKSLVSKGVVGFKSFLIETGVDEFQHVTAEEVQIALQQLQGTGTVLAFHAELPVSNPIIDQKQDPKKYTSFLNTRPKQMENDAIKLVIDLCNKYSVRCHIVHLSSSEALPFIREAKKNGTKLTVETCYHYLCLDAESIADGESQFKCCPPIREKSNKEALWQGLKEGLIDQVVSDHSPCTSNLKTKDFLTAWGGIASVQFGLSLLWTQAKKRNCSIAMISNWLSAKPAQLCGIDHSKGVIKEGMDADFVIWNPNKQFKVTEDMILHKNKVTPYIGNTLQGVVLQTILRGNVIYDNGQVIQFPKGKFVNIR